MAKVGIVMGSDSDFGIMGKALDILKEFGVEAEVRVISALRTAVYTNVHHFLLCRGRRCFPPPFANIGSDSLFVILR